MPDRARVPILFKNDLVLMLGNRRYGGKHLSVKLGLPLGGPAQLDAAGGRAYCSTLASCPVVRSRSSSACCFA